MSFKTKSRILMVPSLLVLSGCVTDRQIDERISKVIEENPELLFKVIEDRPEKFMTMIEKAAFKARQVRQAKQIEHDKQEMLKAIAKPLKPYIREGEAVRGVKGAPLQIVEYSDFQCPYCKRGASTMKQIMSKYKGKVEVVYKHTPLSFHPQAMITSKYYEALRIQNPKWAFEFHNIVFENQGKLSRGERYLRGISKRLGADLKKLEKDLQSSFVQKRISEDMKEAKNFGFEATPIYLVNGVPVSGAQPLAKFEEVITALKNQAGLKI